MPGRWRFVEPELGVFAVLAFSLLGGCGDGDTPSSASAGYAGGGSAGTSISDDHAGSGGASVWTMQIVDESPTAIAAALALDGSGYAHIVYSENPVFYATNASGSWGSESLEPEAGAHSPSLAVGKDGVVHVAFVRDGEIWYLRNQDGVWTAEGVAPGEWPSIAVDGSGSAHLSLTRDCSVYYATNANGQWTTEAVSLSHTVGNLDYDIEVSHYTYCGPTAITVDTNNRPHIVYPGTVTTSNAIAAVDRLHHAGYVGGTWSSHDIDQIGFDEHATTDYPRSDVAADAAGRLHASYFARGARFANPYELRYVKDGGTTPCGVVQWRAPIIVDGSDTVRTGISSAIGLDPWGGVHVSYYVQEVFDEGEPYGCTLRYASNVEGSWATESIETDCAVPGQGRDTLAVGADGVVHLVYHARDRALTYATREYTGDRSVRLDESQSSAGEASGDCSGALTFSSQVFCEAVWDAIGNPEDEISSSDVASLATLHVSRVSSLEGIECLSALSTLGIGDSPGLDLEPLATLTNLTTLELVHNQLSDVGPLASLTNLTTLVLWENHMVDVGPLASLTNLTTLELWENQIVDVGPLALLTNLTTLDLSKNQIVDVAPLASLRNLTTLRLYENQIADVGPLASLTNLTTIDLSRNQIADVGPLASLTNLTTLDLYGNQVVDVGPLASLTNLTTLGVSKNQIVDVAPLASLRSLTTLDLYENQIADVGPLASLTNLTTLRLSKNQIADVGPLASLTNLTTLDLYDNQVVDVGPLASLTNLTTLDLCDNQVVDVGPLASLTNLTTLDLCDNQITNIAPLLSVENFRVLNLAGNPLECASQSPYLYELRARGVAVSGIHC